MKKLIAIILSVIFMCACLVPAVMAEDEEEVKYEYTVKREDIVIRDPFILLEDGKYYMYGAGVVNNGYGCYVSEDLEKWAGPLTVFTFPEGSDISGDYRAPECVKFGGKFYLFATCKSATTGNRGTVVFSSKKPVGPFEQVGKSFVTPEDSDCADSTFYVDPEGQPWLAYVHSAAPDGVGKICVAQLNSNLTALTTSPLEIFRADDSASGMNGNVTDGPYIYTCEDGKLIMLWSNVSDKGYSVGVAECYCIDGMWRQQQRIALDGNVAGTGYDGGHGMIFTTKDEKIMLATHSPDTADGEKHETAVFSELIEVDGKLNVKSAYEDEQNSLNKVKDIIGKIAEYLSKAWGFLAGIFAKITGLIKF